MGKRSRVKGYRGEHEVERLFRERGFDARRVPLSGASVFQKGDVVIFIDGQPRWVVEVKRRKKGFVELYRWLEEADIVFHRSDRAQWLVTMDVQTFWELVGKCMSK